MLSEIKKKTRSLSHLTFSKYLAFTFISIISITTSSTIFLTYQQSKELVIERAKKDIKNFADDTENELKEVYKGTQGTIDLLGRSAFKDFMFSEEPIFSRSLLSKILDENPMVNQIEVAGENGAYFFATKLIDGRESIYGAQKGEMYLFRTMMLDQVTQKNFGHQWFYSNTLEQTRKLNWIKTGFDARKKSWYSKVNNSGKTLASKPYISKVNHQASYFLSTHFTDDNIVISAEVSLNEISKNLSRNKLTESSERMLINTKGDVIASSNREQVLRHPSTGALYLLNVSEIKDTAIVKIFLEGSSDEGIKINFNGSNWYGSVNYLELIKGEELIILDSSPEDELLADVYQLAFVSELLSVAILFLAIPMSLFMASQLSQPLDKLKLSTQKLKNFEFSKPIDLKTKFDEINELTAVTDQMRATIDRYIIASKRLSTETDIEKILDVLLHESVSSAKVAFGIVYLHDDKTNRCIPRKWQSQNKLENDFSRCILEYGEVFTDNLINAVSSTGLVIKPETPGVPASFSLWFEHLKSKSIGVASVPLYGNDDEFVGVLFLADDEDVYLNGVMDRGRLRYIQSLCSVAATKIESQSLLEGQTLLIDSFIRVLSEAIDSKSPYTGGHASRVPEVAYELARAANESTEGPFKHFHLNKDKWKQLEVASMLHDCGKVVTPEYVMDKSVKLETIYNRIHEIRMRFELIKCEAERDMWKRVSQGENKILALHHLKEYQQGLDEDFKFICQLNTCSIQCDDEAQQRLHAISEKTWTQTIDDQLGMSPIELDLVRTEAKQSLPKKTPLLLDLQRHIVDHLPCDLEVAEPDNQWGFKINMPEHRFNNGEVHNLKIFRGTLTPEERNVIEFHSVATIRMLNELPFPAKLKDVVEIAGNHHERMDGNGYPRKIDGKTMRAEAKILAIADVFEALTANDRPYKKANKLSDAVKIMGIMVNNGHLDRDLFELFIESEAYIKYAEKFLSIEQIDIESKLHKKSA